MRIPKLTIYQTVLEALTLLLVIACIIGTLISYKALPDTIPTHFNAAGEIDGYNGRGSVFVMPVVSLLMYAQMTVFIFIPKVIENPNTLSQLDMRFKPLIARETISLLGECKLLCIVMFDYMQIYMLMCRSPVLGPVWLICCLMLADTIYRTIRLSKYKKY